MLRYGDAGRYNEIVRCLLLYIKSPCIKELQRQTNTSVWSWQFKHCKWCCHLLCDFFKKNAEYFVKFFIKQKAVIPQPNGSGISRTFSVLTLCKDIFCLINTTL